MRVLGNIFGAIFDAMLAVSSWMGPAGSLIAISTFLGVLMLFAFKYIGDEQALTVSKNRMQAHLMEMRLFDREPKLVFRAMGQLFWWNAKFFVATLRPAIVATIPMILLFVQMEHYYGVRALRPGEAAVVTMAMDDAATIEVTGTGVDVETPVVHYDAGKMASFRVRGQEAGTGTLSIKVGEHSVDKSVSIATTPQKVSMRRARDLSESWMYPIEHPVEAPGVKWVDVAYPGQEIKIAGFALHWLWWLVIISVLGAFVIRWGVNKLRPETF